MAKSPKLLKLPRSRPANKNGLNQEQLMERREKAYQMRVIDRKGFRDIAEALGVSLSTAKDDCEFIVKMKVRGMIELDQEKKAEMRDVCEEVLDQWLPLMKSMLSGESVVEEVKTGRDGEPRIIRLSAWEAAGTATDKILKSVDQISKLEGFYATKSESKSPLEMGQEFGMGIMEAMRNLASKTLPVMEAEVVQDKLT